MNIKVYLCVFLKSNWDGGARDFGLTRTPIRAALKANRDRYRVGV